MRTLPAGMDAMLASGVTSLCWCWKLTDRSGRSFGFTDHDEDISFDAMLYEALSGFAPTEIESSLGLAVDNLEVAGALSSLNLNESDLGAGVFDNAAVEIWLVNWQAPDQRLLMRSGVLGEVSRGEVGFTAEVRGLADQLRQPRGRLYQFGCDADVGDVRCGVDLGSSAYRADVIVADASTEDRFTTASLAAYADHWFTRGLLTWTTGANAGFTAEIKAHRLGQSGASVSLWQPPAHPIATGDQATLTAGCDKQFSTCRAKFANGVNFRGFPHMPGNDFILRYPNADDTGNDGAARN